MGDDETLTGAALRTVFIALMLWMVLVLVPFVLSWFLREVPLRTTVAHAAESAPPEPPGQLAWESPDR